MAKQNEKSAANDIQSMFDPQNYQNFFKTWASMNERMTTIMVDAGQRSTKITSETADEALTNLRDAAQVREEPAEYAQAIANLMQKQMELSMRAMQSFAEVSQQTGSDAGELVSEAGNSITDKATANAERFADKASAATKKAA
jgi:hypothetical protein